MKSKHYGPSLPFENLSMCFCVKIITMKCMWEKSVPNENWKYSIPEILTWATSTLWECFVLGQEVLETKYCQIWRFFSFFFFFKTWLIREKNHFSLRRNLGCKIECGCTLLSLSNRIWTWLSGHGIQVGSSAAKVTLSEDPVLAVS